MYRYYAFQLKIVSEIAFPELLEYASQPSDTDIQITFGDVSPQGLDAPIKKREYMQANEHMLWLNIPKVARFLVAYGQQITVDPVPGIDEASIRIFLLGSCFGALLMQRGLFLLHGNAIQIGQQSISFTGRSGAGKSTLTGAFLKRGYSILADDVCAINEQGETIPSFPQIKLWADAAKYLAIETTTLRKIRPNIEKFAVPLGDKFQQNPLPLKHIYILNIHNKEQLAIVDLVGMNKLQPLKNQLYRFHYLKGMSKERGILNQCGRIANGISLANLTRPQRNCTIDNLIDFIESDLEIRGFKR